MYPRNAKSMKSTQCLGCRDGQLHGHRVSGAEADGAGAGGGGQRTIGLDGDGGVALPEGGGAEVDGRGWAGPSGDEVGDKIR